MFILLFYLRLCQESFLPWKVLTTFFGFVSVIKQSGQQTSDRDTINQAFFKPNTKHELKKFENLKYMQLTQNCLAPEIFQSLRVCFRVLYMWKQIELKAIYLGNKSNICEVVILTGQTGHTPIRMLLGAAQLWDQWDLSLTRQDRITRAGQAFH